MTDAANSDLEEVRSVLFGSERAELAELRARVAGIEALEDRIHSLEQIVLESSNRTQAVSEVLIGAVENVDGTPDDLGVALVPSMEHAVRTSARIDSSNLADALYPVMGPAMRKMIANMFTFGPDGSTKTFRVDQVLLIERESGILLAATATDETALQDADVVSGMLDAIRLFVQDAFDTPEHDGLQDLRVGDTSVLVEWGPRAVLASVVHGVPDENYRARASATLEAIHVDYHGALEDFDGSVDALDDTTVSLEALQSTAQDDSNGSSAIWWILGIITVVIIVAIIVLLAR